MNGLTRTATLTFSAILNPGASKLLCELACHLGLHTAAGSFVRMLRLRSLARHACALLGHESCDFVSSLTSPQIAIPAVLQVLPASVNYTLSSQVKYGLWSLAVQRRQCRR